MNCDYCSQKITGSYLRNFWGHKYHTHHEENGSRCKCCSTLIMPSLGSLKMEDDSEICNHCLPEAILRKKQMDRCVKAVFEFYRMGDIFFREDLISFELVMERDLPKNALGQFVYSKGLYAIKVLQGLNKSIFCGVIAHELMHVYLKEHNFNFPLDQEEGLCEVSRYFALKTIGGKLSEASIQALEQSDDPIYGFGYRSMKKRIIEKGGSIQHFLATEVNKQKILF